MPDPILTIRHAQLSHLGDHMERKFIDGLVEHFARLYPDVEAIRERVTAAVDRARGYAITPRDDIKWFVTLDMDRGPEWEKQPDMDWALDILDNPAVDPAGRRFRLEKWIRRWDGDAC